MKPAHIPPDWAFEFHGHRCPFMPIGYRMGKLAMENLRVEYEKDHGFFVFPEIGEGHPQNLLQLRHRGQRRPVGAEEHALDANLAENARGILLRQTPVRINRDTVGS